MGSVAFIFPGQGSQSLGMCNSIEEEILAVKDRFEVGSDILGVNLWQLIKEGPVEKLNQTKYTQPAMLASNVAFYDIWKKLGGEQADVMAGHSLGEYAALVCANILDYEEAMSLVIKRGILMQEAVPKGIGSMAAIMGLNEEALNAVCKEVNDKKGDLVVECANLNTEEQIVISGYSKAVEVASELALERGAKRALALDVSVPSHCSLMKKASSEFAKHINKDSFEIGPISVVQNVDAEVCKSSQTITDLLVKQLYSPVRWTDTINNLKKYGCKKIYECGPGKTLTGLNRRIDRKLEAVALNSLEALKQHSQNKT